MLAPVSCYKSSAATHKFLRGAGYNCNVEIPRWNHGLAGEGEREVETPLEGRFAREGLFREEGI